MNADITMQPRYKWIYLLPNLFTTFTLSAGFYSIVMAVKGNFTLAAMAIFVAFFADGFDGFTARLTHTQSQFGAEYDSFSDLVAFGIAPAFLVYLWSLSSLGEYSWLIALLYAVATALRLARFNALLSSNEKYFFRGLPCPIAAGMIASTIFLCSHYDISGMSMALFLAGGVILLACLMVSTIHYYSIRAINSKMKWAFFTSALLVVVILTMNARPEGFFCLFSAYVLSCVFISQRAKVK